MFNRFLKEARIRPPNEMLDFILISIVEDFYKYDFLFQYSILTIFILISIYNYSLD